MYGRVVGVAVVGMRGRLLAVEAHIGRGLPALSITGLPGSTFGTLETAFVPRWSAPDCSGRCAESW